MHTQTKTAETDRPTVTEKSLLIRWEDWVIDLFATEAGSLGITIDQPYPGMTTSIYAEIPSIDLFVQDDLKVISADAVMSLDHIQNVEGDEQIPTRVYWEGWGVALRIIEDVLVLTIDRQETEFVDLFVSEDLELCYDLTRGKAAEERRQKLEQYSDYHKDFYGYRPKAHLMSEDETIAAYDKIVAAHNALEATPEGRAQLRANGWIIGEEAEA